MTINVIKSILPIAEKSLFVFIAKTESPPKATVVKINAFATILAPPGMPSVCESRGTMVNQLTNVNPKRSIMLIPAFLLNAYSPNKKTNSKMTSHQYQEVMAFAIPIPTYAPALAASSEAANS